MSNVFRICRGCGKNRLIVNKTFVLCDDCNQLRLHGKDRFTRKVENIKSQQENRKSNKVTGEARLFKEIWEEREHVCHNCKIQLGDEMKTYFFMHKKSKGAYPSLRLEKANIELACYDCHTAYDRISTEAYELRRDLYLYK